MEKIWSHCLKRRPQKPFLSDAVSLKAVPFFKGVSRTPTKHSIAFRGCFTVPQSENVKKIVSVKSMRKHVPLILKSVKRAHGTERFLMKPRDVFVDVFFCVQAITEEA